MSENGEIYTADKKFTLPPAVTAVTNSTSADKLHIMYIWNSIFASILKKIVKPLEAGRLHITSFSIFTQFPNLGKLADSLDVDPLVNSHRGSHL